MGVVVAEYLGVRTDREHALDAIKVYKGGDGQGRLNVKCPFMEDFCVKARRGDKPICSLRDTASYKLWVVCEHRLCATKKGSIRNPVPLGGYQKEMLHSIAKEIYSPVIDRDDVLVKREVSVPVTATASYSADYVMWRKNPNLTTTSAPDRPVILEMQGGGETSNTGDLTKHIKQWEEGNGVLSAPVSSVNPLITNAWRRQQEQFLVKGNAAMLTGGKMVFCLGSLIYEYLMPRLQRTTIFPDLRAANWTLALLAIVECTDSESPLLEHAPQSIPLKVDPDRSLFTNYGFFVQAITNQGMASNEIFEGPYEALI